MARQATPKSSALRFLKIRPRSIAELREKLTVKGFQAGDIEATIHDLTASGLLDDRAFTKSWITYRLARPFGFRRIIQELKAKGIDQQMIDEVRAQVEGYSPEATALELAQRRWQRLPDIDPQKKKKRVMDFLVRRGFEVQIVFDVIKKLK